MNIVLQLIFSFVILWPATLSQNFYVPIQENELAYEFHYNINDLLSGVVTHRWESKYGDYVRGSYSFLEPNGMIRNVNYEVDGKRGYRAVTKFFKPQQRNWSVQEIGISILEENGPTRTIIVRGYYVQGCWTGSA